MDTSTLQKRYDRAERKIQALERLIEERSRALYAAREKLEDTMRFLERVLTTMPSALLVVQPDGFIRSVNVATETLTGYERAELEGRMISDIVELPPHETRDVLEALLSHGGETVLKRKSGTPVPVLFSSTVWHDEQGERSGAVCLAHDLREKRQLELELRHAQKLESVGQLAAGVAHEINTPIQFSGDSLYFLQEAFDDLGTLLQRQEVLQGAASEHEELQGLCASVKDAAAEIDLEFLREEIPSALERARSGIDRVSKIVRAMKAFSHPASCEKRASDINKAIETTLEICRHEWKYVAELSLDLGDVPEVECNIGDLNQVFLNLVVNAAHAIAERGTDGLGKITIRTRRCDDRVEVEIADTGLGIPTEIQERVFDPFFTTKEVGKGSGQGLAISRRIIVDGHGGSLRFDTQPGVGTSFVISLPLRSEA